MSGEIEYDDDWDLDADERQDNNVLRELRKQNKSKDRQIKELQEQLSGLSKNVRERSVKDVLTSRGLNPKISAFIPEGISSEEEVAAWVDEYGEVFGAAPQQQEEPSRGDDRPELHDLSKISDMQRSGQPFDSDPSQLAARISSASSPEELNKLLFGSAAGPQTF